MRRVPRHGLDAEILRVFIEATCRKSRRPIDMRESRTGRSTVFRCQKAKSCAIVSHGENVQAQSWGEQRALRYSWRCCCVSFSILRSQTANLGLSSRGGLVCWLTVRPVPWMLHFVTKRHQKRYSCCSGCSMWVIFGLCQTISLLP